jgi:hypothetical protein
MDNENESFCLLFKILLGQEKNLCKQYLYAFFKDHLQKIEK